MPRFKFKEIERAYGFDEVALVPGDVTINPDQTNIDFTVRDYTLSIPILASAMDAIVDTAFAIKFGKLGGLAVLNLEGIQTRYENPDEVLNKIVQTPEEKVTSLLQKIYSEPIKEKLISQRIEAIKQAGAICAVSVSSQHQTINSYSQGCRDGYTRGAIYRHHSQTYLQELPGTYPA